MALALVGRTWSDPVSGGHARSAVAPRSQWDRITLAPDIELHVRRPLAREDNRRLERLLEVAECDAGCEDPPRFAPRRSLMSAFVQDRPPCRHRPAE